MLVEIIEFIKDMIKYIIIIAVIIMIRVYVLTTTEVINSSMEPNLNDGNILLVDQLTSRFDNFKRFDVVSFEHSPTFLIKRVIGLPGEIIQYKDDKLYINDKLITSKFKTNGPTNNFGPVVIPKDQYFVMGDNRIDSTDSRDFGPIEKEKIVGKVFLGIWPLNKLQVVN